jgi:hypothetical protein
MLSFIFCRAQDKPGKKSDLKLTLILTILTLIRSIREMILNYGSRWIQQQDCSDIYTVSK